MNKPNRNLTSIVSYPERGTGGNNRYRGNCSPKLIGASLAAIWNIPAFIASVKAKT